MQTRIYLGEARRTPACVGNLPEDKGVRPDFQQKAPFPLMGRRNAPALLQGSVSIVLIGNDII